MRRSRLIFAKDGRLTDRIARLVLALPKWRDRSQFIEGHRIGIGWYLNRPRPWIDLRVHFELLDPRGDIDASLAKAPRAQGVADAYETGKAGGVSGIIDAPGAVVGGGENRLAVLHPEVRDPLGRDRDGAP